jgi:hypothetical protein
MDITDIDSRIIQKFKEDEGMIPEYNQKILDIQKILDSGIDDQNMKSKLEQTLSVYKFKINNIVSGNDYDFYISESFHILERYRQILKTPVKVNFFGTQVKDQNSKEKLDLIEQYIQIAKKHISDLDLATAKTNKKQECENCTSTKIVLADGLSIICTECGYEREENTNTLSYKDMSRTNVLQKYTYEKRSHFRDALNQYQGKQNCKIDKKIFIELENEFEKHHLLVGDKSIPKAQRFSKVKKEHVMLFLKELGYDKQYENANYIYSEMTGVKCPDISHLEDQLMEDFDILANLYTKKFKYEKNIERKSFINVQCVFFQLLKKNKYPCKKEDFNILKTTDRKTFHDEILQELFEELGWNYTPFF